MNAKLKSLEREHVWPMVASFVIGLLILVTSTTFLVVLELSGRTISPSPEAQDLLLLLVRLLVYGLLPALAFAFLMNGISIRRYRKGIRQ